MRPRYEGSNIRTWVGFKHFTYLVEEAVLDWFRERGIGPQRLYLDHGLGVEIVDTSVLLPKVLEMDDVVRPDVRHDGGGRFSVRLLVDRDGEEVVLRGTVAVALVREAAADEPSPLPDRHGQVVVDGVVACPGSAADGARAPVVLAPGEPAEAGLARALHDSYLWPWQARYFHCHFSDRVQHSAYIRALEEVVDRFLEARGISVRRMLVERGWIPVVSRARVRMLGDAHMGEVVHTSFVVDDVLRGLCYSGRMDCFVERDRQLVPVATGSILHGYAVSRGDEAGRLAALDDAVVAALTEGTAA